MPSGQKVLNRMDERVRRLELEFPRFVTLFEKAQRFSGPSLHFHRRAIDRRRALGSAEKAVRDEEFMEMLYATLTAWGMHRMGPTKTKLRNLSDIRQNISLHAQEIGSLDNIYLTKLSSDELAPV